MPGSVQERVIETIAKTQHIDAATVRAESTFVELKIDSLDGLQIVFALEEEFRVSIPDEAAKGFTSVSQAIEGIEMLLAKKAEA